MKPACLLSTFNQQGGYAHQCQSFVELIWNAQQRDWAVVFGEVGSFPGFGMAITFAFRQIDGICFVCVRSLSMSRSQYLALLPRCFDYVENKFVCCKPGRYPN